MEYEDARVNAHTLGKEDFMLNAIHLLSFKNNIDCCCHGHVLQLTVTEEKL